MSGEQVLVVDDELSMRQFLQILLERDGYRVRTAASGAEALSLADQQWPELVLTDLNMPGMSGMELLRSLKARAAGATDSRADVQVIMVTAFGTTESAIEAMKHGAVDYILKPFNNDELRLVVRRALGQSRLEAENARLACANDLLRTEVNALRGAMDGLRLRREAQRRARAES